MKIASVLMLMLLVAAVAVAGPLKLPAPVTTTNVVAGKVVNTTVPWLDSGRFHPAIGVGQRWDADNTLSFRGLAPKSFLMGRLTYGVFAHLAVEGQVQRLFSHDSRRWQGEAAILVGW